MSELDDEACIRATLNSGAAYRVVGITGTQVPVADTYLAVGDAQLRKP